jgi:hypothetical protein
VQHPQLRAGRSYWLTVLPAPLSNYSCWEWQVCGSSDRWCQNSTGDLNEENVAESSDLSVWRLSYGGAPWDPPRARGAFQINGDTAIELAFDIKPDTLPNSVNPRSHGVIPVAILGSAAFDVTAVRTATLRFGRTGTEAPVAHSALQYVDGDRYVDLVLHFRTQQTGLACGSTQASLTGTALDGRKIHGTDSVRTVGCK